VNEYVKMEIDDYIFDGIEKLTEKNKNEGNTFITE